MNEYKNILFVTIVLSSLIITRYFQVYMIKLTNEVMFDFEIHVLDKIKKSSLEDFEALGKENVYTAINDTKTLAHVPEVFMNAFNSLIVVICCFSYMFWVSIIGGTIILATMLLLLTIYLIRNKGIEKELNIQRDLQNTYYKYLSDSLSGFKELKMSYQRSLNIFKNFIVPNRVSNKDIAIHTGIKYLDNELTGTYSWYIVFGVILFILPELFNLDSKVITVFLVTILYLIGPIAVLITIIPTYTSIKIAVERLNIFNHRLVISDEENESPKIEGLQNSFQSIEFIGAAFEYAHTALSKTTFNLNPVTLKINKGEVIFVIGGNGSGKSTFGYLLTGLYQPTSGAIVINGSEKSSDDIQQYRNFISAIFTDNYLFSENYDGFELNSNNKIFTDLVHQLKMHDVLRIDEGLNKIDHNLSKGQKKRLSLIYTLLEDKPVIVLDEWAAEQDPAFRGYFYKELIPSLKARGKTIIVITHDDEYYTHATRIIKFNFGSIVSDHQIEKAAPMIN